ncbi:TadE family type IV pilus minor pilin [Georgenia alba]|uniref:TadE family type IV pilus minor pilin n=1 Tax=Georgenia alba TaxID=2233858 RepID=A0ABW2Q616_9MICO
MPRREDPERGSATAETALVLPAVVMLLVVLLVAASAAVTQVRVADAARAGARSAALGETSQVVHDLTQELAGEDAAVRIGRDGAYVVVEVTRRIPGPLGLADLQASASARALPEPGEGP